jgi:hypothetical protein
MRYRRITVTPKLLGLVCLVVLAVILMLGLWPCYIPVNDVTWLQGRPGLRFGRNSTVISSRSIRMSRPGQEPGASVEICLEPGRIWGDGTFLGFYAPERSFQLLLRQSLTDLEIQTRQKRPGGLATAKLYAADVFRKARPLFVTVTSGPRGTMVYIDGVLVKAAAEFWLPAEDFAGRLLIGDSPGQTDSWAGYIFGLAVYHRELQQPQVARHYLTWTQKGFPDIARDAGYVALYQIDEHSGRIVHDKSGSGLDLFIPERYLVVDQILLEPFWQEFSMSRSYWSAVLKNVVGFIPVGCCFYAWFMACRVKRAAFATVILGTAISLTIEILQAYLPTRDSGTTDIFTNTLGTWVGVVSYRFVRPFVSGRFPWSPVVVAEPVGARDKG